MTDKTIPLLCPKCGKSAFQAPADLKLDAPIVCASCGASVNAKELKTTSGKNILDFAADALRKRLKGLKGFKPRR